jgi:hypothetical protein
MKMNIQQTSGIENGINNHIAGVQANGELADSELGKMHGGYTIPAWITYMMNFFGDPHVYSYKPYFNDEA